MGTLYQRGKNGIWWLKYYHNGKPIRESSGSEKKMVAKRLLEQREGQIAEGKVPGVYFDKVSLSELAEDFLTDYRVNGKKSTDRAKLSARHLREFFGDVRASAIDTAGIRKYIDRRLSEGAAKATVNRELAALKRMFTLAIIADKIDRRPHIPKLQEDNVRKGFFEHGEFLVLRGMLPEYLQGYAAFAYKSGWRTGEIRNLQWKQVDRARGIVTLNPGETKNGVGRTLYLDAELKQVIEHQWELRKQTATLSPYVFPNADGTGRIKSFRHSWATACKDAGLGKRLFHDFRRTAVRNMVRAGIPERVAMQISGHKTRSIFDRYNIVSDVDLRLAPEKLAAYLSEKSDAMGTISGTIEGLQAKDESAGASVSACEKHGYRTLGR